MTTEQKLLDLLAQIIAYLPSSVPSDLKDQVVVLRYTMLTEARQSLDEGMR